MILTVQPGSPLRGIARVPGDKSLSHRALLFAALAEGESRIKNFLVSGVTKVMFDALAALGVTWELDGDELVIQGRGIRGLQAPGKTLDCGNSATTIRLLAGALSAAGIGARLDGSAGLRRRPMDRIVDPLRQMGVCIETAPGGSAPLEIQGRSSGELLNALRITLPVASAQVKTCLLLAALSADGETVIREPGPSRDHTERMLASMGVQIEKSELEEAGFLWFETRLIPPRSSLAPLNIILPGDCSAAAFLIAAALLTPGSDVEIPGVGINPTRTGLIDALRDMGGQIEITNQTLQAGEPVGNLRVRYSLLNGGRVDGPLVVRMIDEFSAFGAVAAYAGGQTVVRNAAELRLKESDRIHSLCQELEKLGVSTDEIEDGFTIYGGKHPRGGMVVSHGDHRLSMAMATLGLGAAGPVSVSGAEIIDESFPGFVACLRGLGANLAITQAEAV